MRTRDLMFVSWSSGVLTGLVIAILTLGAAWIFQPIHMAKLDERASKPLAQAQIFQKNSIELNGPATEAQHGIIPQASEEEKTAN